MPLYGVVDYAESPYIAGWVCTESDESARPAIDIMVLGRIVVSASADLTRSDLNDKKGYHGFRVRVPDGFSPRDLSNRNLTIIARMHNNCADLKVWRTLEIAGKLDEAICDLLPKAIKLLPREQRKSLAEAVTSECMGGLSPGAKEEGPGVGLISGDEAAIIGRNGHMFLFQGNNRVKEIYGESTPPTKLIAGWKELCEGRAERFMGASYVKIVIPEKSSVTPEFVPYSVNGPSALWRRVVTELGSLCREDFQFIDCEALFRRSPFPESTFRLIDSHLTTYGCGLIVDAVLRECFLGTTYQVEGQRWESRSGDLGRRFSSSQGAEPMELVRLINGLLGPEGSVLEPKLVDSYDPPNGHQGYRRHWTCANAPIRQRVVCFGNSFFELGRSSTHLSWWFSRLFREFHFVWSADVDWSYLDKCVPDFVITQSIERFLRQVPQS